MMATVIPRDSTKNRNLSGKGEPAMRATETPLGAMMVTAGHDGDGDPLGAMRATAGHDGNGDPQALRETARSRKENPAMMATVWPTSVKMWSVSGRSKEASFNNVEND